MLYANTSLLDVFESASVIFDGTFKFQRYLSSNNYNRVWLKFNQDVWMVRIYLWFAAF